MPVSNTRRPWARLRRWPGAVLLALGLAGTLPPGATAAGPSPGDSWRQRPSLATPIAVFGRDDRTALPQSHARIGQAVGLMTNPRARSVCTAFCVADDVVATAAHCLFRTADEPMPRMEDFTFARVRATSPQSSRIAGHASRTALGHVVAGSTSLSVRPPIDATRDWAVARLASPVCRGHALPLAPADAGALAEAAASNRLMVVGYHRDFSHWRLALSRRCEIKSIDSGIDAVGLRRDFIDPDRLVLHTCDTGGASSGSPLLIESERGPVVVGINVGTYVQSKVMMRNGEVVHRFKADEIANTAVSIGTPAAALAALARAEPLSVPAQLKELQRQLASRGHYDGPIDGVLGHRLRAAIVAYETGSGAIATGLPTRALLTSLGGAAVLAEATQSSARKRTAGTHRRNRQVGLD